MKMPDCARQSSQGKPGLAGPQGPAGPKGSKVSMCMWISDEFKFYHSNVFTFTVVCPCRGKLGWQDLAFQDPK